MKHTDLMKEVSKETGIRLEVVNQVVDSMTDIILENIANGKEIILKNLVGFSINYSTNRVVPANPKDPTSEKKFIPNLAYVKVRVSSTMKQLLRLQHHNFSNQPGLVNRKTWRGAMKWFKEGNARVLGEKIKNNNENENHELLNHFLDDND